MIVSVQPNPQKTILSQLSDMGVSVTTQCRSGYCNACRCNLKKGVVVHTSDALVATESDVLPCSSYAVSTIQLEINQ